MQSSPANILVIHFGQLGDVVLSLAALGAIAKRFAQARRTIMVGASAADIVRMTRLFDEVIAVDRVTLRDQGKARSVAEIIGIVRDVRRSRFDLVIDLHSLPETNLLGFVSGARQRLFANRESRSIDMLSNFRPRPAKEDKSIHVSDVYLQAIAPLGIDPSELGSITLQPFESDLETARNLLPAERPLIGLNPGAGHPSRRWPVERFRELAEVLIRGGSRVAVFLGPEEKSLRGHFEFDDGCPVSVVDGLTLPQFVAALSLVDVLAGNDTGPMHLANAVGTPVVVLAHEAAPARFLPVGDRVSVMRGERLEAISVAEVENALLRSVTP